MEGTGYFTNIKNEYDNYLNKYGVIAKNLVDLLRRKLGMERGYVESICGVVYFINCSSKFVVVAYWIKVHGGNVIADYVVYGGTTTFYYLIYLFC